MTLKEIYELKYNEFINKYKDAQVLDRCEKCGVPIRCIDKDGYHQMEFTHNVLRLCCKCSYSSNLIRDNDFYHIMQLDITFSHSLNIFPRHFIIFHKPRLKDIDRNSFLDMEDAKTILKYISKFGKSTQKKIKASLLSYYAFREGV